MVTAVVLAQLLPLLSNEFINVHDLAICINALEVAKDPEFFVDGDILAHGVNYLSGFLHSNLLWEVGADRAKGRRACGFSDVPSRAGVKVKFPATTQPPSTAQLKILINAMRDRMLAYKKQSLAENESLVMLLRNVAESWGESPSTMIGLMKDKAIARDFRLN